MSFKPIQKLAVTHTLSSGEQLAKALELRKQENAALFL